MFCSAKIPATAYNIYWSSLKVAVDLIYLVFHIYFLYVVFLCMLTRSFHLRCARYVTPPKPSFLRKPPFFAPAMLFRSLIKDWQQHNRKSTARFSFVTSILSVLSFLATQFTKKFLTWINIPARRHFEKQLPVILGNNENKRENQTFNCHFL